MVLHKDATGRKLLRWICLLRAIGKAALSGTITLERHTKKAEEYRSMSEFKKPRKGLYRRYLFIDGNEAINSLSALEGGAIESRYSLDQLKKTTGIEA